MMQSSRLPVLALLGLLILQPAWVVDHPSALLSPSMAQSAEIPSDLMIVLERTDCFTWCSAYTLTIYGDGRVVYVGAENVKIVGEATGRIDPEAIVKVLGRFEALRFFDLRDQYSRGAGCKGRRTDMPFATVTLSMHGRVKRVEHDLSCVLPELEELEGTIDREARSQKWVR
jgi:hypothetical protein